jgi:peptide/nickel transport system permease protein
MDRSRLRFAFRELFTRPTSLVGVILIAFFVIVAAAAPLLAPPENPDEPFKMPRDGYLQQPQPPSEDHPFGTSAGQYDVYYGVVWGTRTAFKVGLIVTLSTFTLGLLVGSVAGYYGGIVDDILMRIVEIIQAFPFLLAAITLSSVLRASAPHLEALWIAMAALIIFGWTTYARLIRGNILALKEFDYVMAARAIGARDIRILFRHIMPNAIFPVLVVASMNLGDVVLSFSALSFLGLGVDVDYSDWGQLISFARDWIASLDKYPHIVFYPGIAIVLFVMGWNLLGDTIRDIVDPRMSGSR